METRREMWVMVRKVFTGRSKVRPNFLYCLILKLTIAAGLAVACGVPALAAETVRYYYTDSQGTALSVTDQTGSVLAIYDYRPYGYGLLNQSTVPGFAGHANDLDTGLIYMGARYYDPVSGRFVSRDPVRFQGGNVFASNEYVYANANPFVYTDPTGMFACTGSDVESCMLKQQKDEIQGAPPSLQASGASSVAPQCDDEECNRYRATNQAILQGQANALEDAGKYAAVQGAVLVGAGPVEKLLAKLSLILRVGKVARFSEAAAEYDRNGLTQAGRALQKHSMRATADFFRGKYGHAELSKVGQSIVDDILVYSGGRGQPNKYGGLDFIGASGEGIRFDANGKYMGLLEP